MNDEVGWATRFFTLETISLLCGLNTHAKLALWEFLNTGIITSTHAVIQQYGCATCD